MAQLSFCSKTTRVLCWDGERCSLVFFDITRVLRWDGERCSLIFFDTTRVLCWDGERFSLVFFDITRVLYWDGTLRFAVLPLSKPGWDEFSLSFYDGNQFSVLGSSTLPFCRLARQVGNGSVFSFSM